MSDHESEIFFTFFAVKLIGGPHTDFKNKWLMMISRGKWLRELWEQMMLSLNLTHPSCRIQAVCLSSSHFTPASLNVLLGKWVIMTVIWSVYWVCKTLNTVPDMELGLICSSGCNYSECTLSLWEVYVWLINYMVTPSLCVCFKGVTLSNGFEGHQTWDREVG